MGFFLSRFCRRNSNMESDIVWAMVIMGSLGVFFGVGLAIASKFFLITRDQRIERIEAVLPGVNCGACGAPGCSGFAEGVVSMNFPVTGCIVGGKAVADLVADIMGMASSEVVPKIAIVHCQGNHENAVDRAGYAGVTDCHAAILINNGSKGCEYGCLGLGTCEVSCPFDAIKMSFNGLPVIDELLCTGCGGCVRACPRNIISLLPRNQKVILACMSKDFGKSVKSVCSVGCIGCGLCATAKVTANEIITMDGKLPVIHYDRVSKPLKDLQNAVDKCPSGCFIVRKAETASRIISEKEKCS
jgi:electron transport complex protein RnfB